MITARQLRETEARTCAGHLALALIKDHGSDVGGAIISGYLQAFCVANAAVHGWANTDKLLAELSRDYRPHPHKAKPKLFIVNE